jgi:hypothetical protein
LEKAGRLKRQEEDSGQAPAEKCCLKMQLNRTPEAYGPCGGEKLICYPFITFKELIVALNASDTDAGRSGTEPGSYL